MKKILISIKPKYVSEILNHRKTLEIRKSCPKCELPCEVYIYCTKNEYLYRTNKGYFASKKPLRVGKGTEYTFAYSDEGMVVAKFTLNKVEEIENDRLWETDKYFLERTCLSFGELACYLSSKNGYAWHIEDLVIFDKPKELGDFIEFGTPTYEQAKPFPEMFGKPYSKETYREDYKKLGYALTKAPQSWCYVEVGE